MTVCPWCKARNPSGTSTCLKCGKRAAEHPSVAGHGVGGDIGEDDEVSEGPALDLDLRTELPTASRGAAPMGHTVGDDWADSAQPGDALDLDLTAPEDVAALAPGTSFAQLQQQHQQHEQHHQQQQHQLHEEKPLAAKEQLTAPKPSGPAPIELDAFEVKALADYGPDPVGIVQAVPYAVRVVMRQRELKRSLEGVRKALAEAEAKRDERLVELGTLLEPVISGNPDYGNFARGLQSAQKVMHEREQALSQTNSAFRERAAAIDAEIAALDGPIGEAKASVEEKTRAFEAADVMRQKHEARRKRVEIEVRNAQATVQRVDATPADKQRAQSFVAAAQQEHGTRGAEEKLAREGAQQAQKGVDAARVVLTDLESKVNGLRIRRRELEKEFTRAGAARSEGVEAASKEVRGALLEIGKRTHQSGPEAPGAEVRRKSVTEAEANVRRLQIDLEKHVRALGAADKTAVRNGLVVLGAAVAIFLGLFIAWRALRTNPYLPADQIPKPSAIPYVAPVRG